MDEQRSRIENVQRSSLSNFLAVILGLLAVLLPILGGEGVLRWKAMRDDGEERHLTRSCIPPLVSSDPTYAFKLIPSQSAQETACVGKNVVYKTNYNVDAYGCRVTSPRGNGEGSKWQFFGCSFTFGTGVDDDETLPSHFSRHLGHGEVVNHGVPGYGPQQLWLWLKAGNLEQVSNTTGLSCCLYVFITHHLRRLEGSADVVAEWSHPMPWLTVEDGVVRHMGTFQDRSPFQYYALKARERSHLLRYASLRLTPKGVQGSEAPSSELFVSVIREVSRGCKTAGARFVMVVYPGNGMSSELKSRVIEAGIEVLDYSALLESELSSQEELFFRDGANGGFGHPKGKAHEIVASQLARDILRDKP